MGSRLADCQQSKGGQAEGESRHTLSRFVSVVSCRKSRRNVDEKCRKSPRTPCRLANQEECCAAKEGQEKKSEEGREVVGKVRD